MRLQHTVKASLRKGEHYYVAECIEIAVVTQGRTVDETLANLQEAIALHLEGVKTLLISASFPIPLSC